MMTKYSNMIPFSLANCRKYIITDAATKETPIICGKSVTKLFSSSTPSRDFTNICARFLSLPRRHSDAGHAATTAGAVISIYGPAAFFYPNEGNCLVSKFLALKKFLCYNNLKAYSGLTSDGHIDTIGALITNSACFISIYY